MTILYVAKIKGLYNGDFWDSPLVKKTGDTRSKPNPYLARVFIACFDIFSFQISAD